MSAQPAVDVPFSPRPPEATQVVNRESDARIVVSSDQSESFDVLDLWLEAGGNLISTRSRKVYLGRLPERHHKLLRTAAESLVEASSSENKCPEVGAESERGRKSDGPQGLEEWVLRTTQLQGVQQESGDQACGYFALHTVSCLSRLLSKLADANCAPQLRGDALKRARRLLVSICRGAQSQSQFEAFKKTMITLLQREVRTRIRQQRDEDPDAEPCYPWTEEHVNSGVLERCFLQHFQGRHFDRVANPEKTPEVLVAEQFGFAYPRDVINLLEFSVAALKTNHLPVHTISKLEDFFEEFHQGSRHWKTFLIGSAIHFVVIAAHRDPRRRTIDLVYLDPQNQDILGLSGAELQREVIANMGFEAWIKRGWKREHMERFAFDSLTGIQAALDLVTHGVLHWDDVFFIRSHLLRLNVVEGFLATFDEHVLKPLEKAFQARNRAPGQPGDVNSPASSEKVGWFVGIPTRLTSDESGARVEVEAKQDSVFTAYGELLANRFALCAEESRALLQEVRNTETHQEAVPFLRENIKVVKRWFQRWYPAGVIDANVAAMLCRLQPFIPEDVVRLLQVWVDFVNLFCIESNRVAPQGTEDDDKPFWQRLASTMVVVQVVCTQTLNQIRQKDL